MVYFSNGSEGDALDDQCIECLHNEDILGLCPIVEIQMEYNYKQCDKNNKDLRAAMNRLVDENAHCRMKPLINHISVVTAQHNGGNCRGPSQ